MTDDIDPAEDCDFCAIVRSEEPRAEIVCVESWIAFFPLQPATPGHTMVVPRRHAPDLWSVDPDLGAELMAAVIRVGRAIREAMLPEGLNLITSAGKVAEQSIYHVRLHVVPRWQHDNFGEIWLPKRDLPGVDRAEVANRIRDACRRADLVDRIATSAATVASPSTMYTAATANRKNGHDAAFPAEATKSSLVAPSEDGSTSSNLRTRS